MTTIDQAIIAELDRFVDPLRRLTDGPQGVQDVLGCLGWDFTSVAGDDIAAISGAAGAIVDAVESLVGGTEAATALASIVALLDAVGQIATKLDDVAAALAAIDLDPPLEPAEIASEILGFLFARALRTSRPAVYETAHVLRLIDGPREAAPPRRVVLRGTDRTVRWAQPFERMRFDRMPELLTDPAGLLGSHYLAGGLAALRTAEDVAGFVERLWRPLGDLLLAVGGEPSLGVPIGVDLVADEQVMEYARSTLRLSYQLGEAGAIGVRLVPLGQHLGGPRLIVSPFGTAEIARQFNGWTLYGAVDTDIDPIVFSPDAVHPPSGDITGVGADLVLLKNPTASGTAFVLGAPESSRIELGAFGLGLGVDLSADGSYDWGPSLFASASKLVVATGDLDGFLASLIGDGVEVDFDLHVRWTRSQGLHLDGGVGLTKRFDVDRTLGPLTISGVELSISPSADAVGLVARADLGIVLGPLAVAVYGTGLRVDVGFPASGGNLGPLHLSLGLSAPTGLGIAIDVGAVSGGGMLNIDVDAGTYDGIVDIEVLGVGISAVVIIETQAPGVDGWSMFFALFLDLPSIQLGFGFTLTGVGGVAGINRTLDPEALGAAVRSGSLDAVLFPENPIAEAPVIIDTFKAIFPAADGRVVFGPIVRIGWGTPTLVEAELGIVLAVPDPVMIAVIGSVTAILPTPDVDLVAIHLDIGGVIDFGAGSLTLSASLHDSHVVGFALSGDMELRANFGGRPEFLMALGGFHPDFVAPAGFPSLGRLRLALSPSPLFEVSFECYLALTSNSVQFGAALDLAAEIAGFGIEGGASFDAMVQFSPFMLSTNLGFYITVKAAGIDLAGVWLDIAVKGPNPWKIDGVARFSVLGFEEQIDVHETIGGRQDEPAIEPVDIRTALTDALSLPDAWTVVSSPSGSGVTVAAAAAADGRQLASPDSTLSVSQRIVPLGLDLEHVGEAPLGDYHRFDIEALKDGLPATGTTVDWFAPATFFDLTPMEAISGPSFEELACGINLGGGDPAAGDAVPGSLEYEQILRDPEMGIERLDLDTYRPLQDDERPLVATAHSQTLSATDPYAATVDTAHHLVDTEYALVDPGTSDELVRHASWSATRGAAGATAAVVVPSWELAS